MSDLPPVRPGYNRDVPMDVANNEPDEVITTSVELSAPVLKLAIAGAIVLVAFLTPPAIWLWRWAL